MTSIKVPERVRDQLNQVVADLTRERGRTVTAAEALEFLYDAHQATVHRRREAAERRLAEAAGNPEAVARAKRIFDSLSLLRQNRLDEDGT